MLIKSPRASSSIAARARIFVLACLAQLGACESSAPDGGGGTSVVCAVSESQRCACGEREGMAICSAAGAWSQCSCPAQERAPGPSDAALPSAPAVVRGMDGGQTAIKSIDGSLPPDAAVAMAPSEGDLPCDVRELLAKRCWECHGTQRQFGAPVSLTSWEELQRPARSKPEQTTAQLALARVQDAKEPMPPAPHERLTEAEVSVLASWLAAGAPKSTLGCDAGVAPPAGPTTKPSKVPKPADCDQTFEVRAHGKPVANDSSKFAIPPKFNDSDYQCFYFDAPYAADSALFWYEPIIDNAEHLHHWILYATNNRLRENGTMGPCQGDPGSQFVAGWGPGTDNVLLPSDVALSMHSGPNAGLILELHYFNDTNSAKEDASGVRFCTGGSNKRAHLAAVHATGSEGVCLEPGSAKEVAGICNPRTDLGDIHITGLWPHMHKRATRMLINIKRADGSTTVLHDAPFDFNAQLYYVKDDIIVRPGDSIETRCFFENDTNKRVRFGEGTEDEMCYGFITAWPIGAIAYPDPLNGLRPDLANRCIDLLSVLGSCNGLADAL